MTGCEVGIVLGAGQIGDATVRGMLARWIPTSARPRLRVVVADVSEPRVSGLAHRLQRLGHDVQSHVVDVTNRDAVTDLAHRCADLGPVLRVVHTVGASPMRSSVEEVLRTGLVGTALVLKAFGDVAGTGGAGVVVTSLAGRIFSSHVTRDDALQIVQTPAEELPDLPLFKGIRELPAAFAIVQRANQLQVQAAAATWRRRSARVNSVSPGLLDTLPTSAIAPSSPASLLGDQLYAALGARPARLDELVDAVDFLTGPRASYVSGTDLLIDGGSLAVQSTA